MLACTFFGHRDTPSAVEALLRSVLIDLIVNKNVTMFYVGNHGNFDAMVRCNLKTLQASYPHVRYAVVLAYIPTDKKVALRDEFSDTICPEGIENVPPKYAIIKRNEWMIEQSEYVVTYVVHTVGGASRFKTLSEKKGKTVFNLIDEKP